MSSSNVDRVQIGYHRSENTQTVSSPHTYAYAKGTAPATTVPDQPTISNVVITSAVAGLPRCPSVKKEDNEEAGQKEVGMGETTHRVEKLSFDMSHTSPPIANLFRRLITTEVPTLAFDRILIEENDGVVLDEILSHRLGLVPVAGPVGRMEYITESNHVGFHNLDPRRVLVFDLQVEGDPNTLVTPVYSRSLQWVPLSGQEEWATSSSEDDRVFLVHPDILLTKLGPRQQLKLRAIAIKGLGTVHAKWSPVSACHYEMKTEISFKRPITGDCALQLEKACPMGVYGVDKHGNAVVMDVENCTLCRECLRKDAYPDFADSICIEKDKTTVRFHIESVGQLHAAQIFHSALTLFAERCRELANLIQSTEVNVVDPAMKAGPNTM